MFSNIVKNIVKNTTQTILVNPNTDKRIDTYIDITTLFELKDKNYTIPNFQRIINTQKVNEIVDIQEKYVKQENNFQFHQSLIFVEMSKYKTSEAYLIDGQHRLDALENLYNRGYKNQYIPITVIQCETFDDVNRIFNEINKNSEMPEYIFECKPKENVSIKLICKHFFHKYKHVWKENSKHPQRPYMSKNLFQDALYYLIKLFEKYKLDYPDEKTIIDMIEDQNSVIENNITTYIHRKYTSNPSNIINKAYRVGCFLGIVPIYHHDMKYEWVIHCFTSYTGIQMEKDKDVRSIRKSRKKIPTGQKTILWNTYFGKQHGCHKCWCCNRNEISQLEFDAGHIVSNADGGGDTIENLRPICRSCNSSMGRMNMIQYMRIYHPTRYDKLDPILQQMESFQDMIMI